MKTIHKYQLSCWSGRHTIEMHEGYEILHVGIQAGTRCVWAMVDTDKPKTVVEFEIIGTGWEMDDDKEYDHIQTLFEEGYVWHVFVVRKKGEGR